MIIRLNEIPAEGREYSYSRQTGELNEALGDIVGKHPYAVEFSIKPIGTAYEMRGTIKTTLDEQCSKCGYDFELPVERKINEILFEDQEEYRKVQGVSGNQSVDFLATGPSMIPVRGDIFEPGSYVHEAIALEEPFYPMCGVNGTCLHEDEVSQVISRLEAESVLGAEKKSVGHPAFSVLEGLTLKQDSKKN